MTYLGKIINLLLVTAICIFFGTGLVYAAWQAPAGNPYTGNDTFSYIINSEGINDYYILNKPFGLDNAFSVNTNALYIDEINNRTGIATNNPQTTLDVWGTVKLFNTSTLPTCNSSILGAIIFNTTQDRLNVCVNNAWRRIGYDGDLDGWLDYVDCDDNNPSLNPGSEICGDTISNDCDSLVNEGCACVASDWSTTLTCPDMSACTTHTTAYGARLTDCVGTANQPSMPCECICRTDSWATITCPQCGPTQTVYANLKTGYSCTDLNNTRTSKLCVAASCPAASNSGLYCYEEDVYYTRTTYTCVSGSCVSNGQRVLSDNCNDSTEHCAAGKCYLNPCPDEPCSVLQSCCVSRGGTYFPPEQYSPTMFIGCRCVIIEGGGIEVEVF